MKQFNLLILLVLSLLLVFSSTGVVWAASADAPAPANLTPEEWTGHSFTFLALPYDKQAAGYDIFPVTQADQGFNGDPSARIPYEKHVGQQATVSQVIPYSAGSGQQEYMVYMTVMDTGEKLVGRTMRGQLEGLVLTDDLKKAKQQFLGKTIYPKFRELSGLYVPGSHETPPAVSIPIGSPVKVVDVFAGNQSQEPIWLVVSANGQKAVLPIAYSWTNMPVANWTEAQPWQDALFVEDPRLTLGWSHTLWYQIETGSVETGMTKGQVLLSWGKPVRTEADDSVWIYENKKLNFSGDVVNSIENVSSNQ